MFATKKRVMGCVLAGLGLLGCSNSAVEESSSTTTAATGSSDNPACLVPTEASEQRLQEITVGGMQRQYRLSVPETEAGRAMPVIVAFHGGGGRDEPFPQQALFDNLVRSQKVIVAYTLGELIPPNEGEWLLNSSPERSQDVDMVHGVLDSLQARYCVDDKRVYAMGYSLGAMFNYDIACQLNQRFAAVVPVAGSMPQNMTSCALVDNVALLHIHGLDDPIIPYDDTWDWKAWPEVGPMRSVPDIIEHWRTRYNCQSFDDTPAGSARHIVYDNCDGGARVEHYGLPNAGHGWPGEVAGQPTAKVVWDFMSGFSKP